MAELRPVALPPAERTIGQLVAESIRFYGEHFWSSLRLGGGPAILAVVSANVSRRTALILSPTLFGALLSATYVYASVLVLGKRPSRGRLVVAWLAGWLVFAPVPFLVLAYVLPGLVSHRSRFSCQCSWSRKLLCEAPSGALGGWREPTTSTESDP